MELRQLECFYLVSTLQNFTRAAEQLHLAQPSVTNAIHSLEDELGLRLFDRAQKKVSLTSEGQAFQRRTEKILREVQEALTEMSDFRHLAKGSIKLAVPPMIGAYLFPNIFAHFSQAHPSLELAVFEEGSMAAQKMLEKEELDLGIIILPHSSNVLNTIPISQQQIMLCVAPTHHLSCEQSVSFDKLKGERFILLKEDSFHRHVVISQCNKYHFAPKVVFSSNQLQTIRALVASGAGISFLMQMVAEDDPHIVGIPLADPIHIDIGLAWKKDKYLSKASHAFIRFIQNYICSSKFSKPYCLSQLGK
jgi:DNA-binding transcriptional LysR family regulator